MSWYTHTTNAVSRLVVPLQSLAEEAYQGGTDVKKERFHAVSSPPWLPWQCEDNSPGHRGPETAVLVVVMMMMMMRMKI